MNKYSKNDITNLIHTLDENRYLTGVAALVHLGILNGNILGATTVDIVVENTHRNLLESIMGYTKRDSDMILHEDSTTSIIVPSEKVLNDKYLKSDKVLIPQHLNEFIATSTPPSKNNELNQLRTLKFPYAPPYNKAVVEKFVEMVFDILPPKSFAICGESADVINGSIDHCSEIHLAICPKLTGIDVRPAIANSVEINGLITELLSDSIFMMYTPLDGYIYNDDKVNIFCGEEHHAARTIVKSFPKGLVQRHTEYVLTRMDEVMRETHEKSPLDVINSVDFDVAIRSRDSGEKLPVELKSVDATHDRDTNDIVVTLHLKAV